MHAQIKARTDLKGELADTLAQISIADGDKSAANETQTDKEAELAAIDPRCDWVMENFDARQEKRKAEIDGLIEAKAILLGSAPKEELIEALPPSSLLDKSDSQHKLFLHH